MERCKPVIMKNKWLGFWDESKLETFSRSFCISMILTHRLMPLIFHKNTPLYVEGLRLRLTWENRILSSGKNRIIISREYNTEFGFPSKQGYENGMLQQIFSHQNCLFDPGKRQNRNHLLHPKAGRSFNNFHSTVNLSRLMYSFRLFGKLES